LYTEYKISSHVDPAEGTPSAEPTPGATQNTISTVFTPQRYHAGKHKEGMRKSNQVKEDKAISFSKLKIILL
jgi:hypothetical protein